mmetsp:Transcript_34414/g.29023  ORF Transcript_34414/g.29023 Transcript_34414/m.29023 type:complete len:111 (+) Transcript_34414:27-359(+)
MTCAHFCGSKLENGFGSSSTSFEIANLNKQEIDNKTIIVTGSNSGIGWETAKTLMINGATVIIAARDISKAEKLFLEFNKEHKDCKYDIIPLDLTSFVSINEFAISFKEK